MAKLYFSFLGLIFSFVLCYSQPNPDYEWMRFYGSDDADGLRDVCLMPDSSYFFIGSTYASSTPPKHFIYLVKTNFNGDTLWTRRYGGDFEKQANSIVRTEDGNAIIAGYSKPALNRDMYFMKVNTDGDTLWTRTYGTPEDERISRIVASNDGNYFGVGLRNSLIKISTNGDSIWCRSYSPGYDARDVAVCPDGGTAILSQYGSEGYFVIRTDQNGDTLWTHYYRNPSVELAAQGVSRGCEYGFAVVGMERTISSLQRKVFIYRIDDDGDSLWYCTHLEDSSEHGYSIMLCADGGFVTASKSLYDEPNYNYLIRRVDENGQELWKRKYGYPGECEEVPRRVEITEDYGLIVVGESFCPQITNDYDGYVVKTGPEQMALTIIPSEESGQVCLRWHSLVPSNFEVYSTTLTNPVGIPPENGWDYRGQISAACHDIIWCDSSNALYRQYMVIATPE